MNSGPSERTTMIRVGADHLHEAARIHSISWKESHSGFCSREFVDLHSVDHQKAYLEGEIRKGKQLFMLQHGRFVGIVSVQGSLIENLYVLPDEQNKGYGTELLLYAVEHCAGRPTLWVLDHNEKARRFYGRHGFACSGKKKEIGNGVFEIEMTGEQRES